MTTSSILTHPLRKHCIAVIGTTGVGKSDFAIQLAQQCKGAILNSDALQIYQGLDILTNKVPLHQQKGIPHHLLSLQPMTEPTFTVINFERMALNLIHQLQSSQTLPIIVGGTHYYLQYLIFGNQDSNSTTTKEPLSPISTSTSIIPNLDQFSPSQLYRHLFDLSPSLAAKWHPNDTRRIKRVLEKWYANPSISSSSTPSPSLSSFSSWSEPTHPVQPKFPCLIFWLYLPFSELDPKLDQRVNEMMQQGLLSEIQSIRHLKNLQKERGIYQAIGCKEWEPYFEALDQGNLDLANSKYEECLQAMKIATKRYARKQLTWIRNKLWPLCHASSTSSSSSSNNNTDMNNQVYVYVLDASQPNLPKVMDIVHAFLENKVSELPCPKTFNPIASEVFAMLKEKESNVSSTEWRKYTCDSCERELNGEQEWMIHLSSKSHRRRLKYITSLHTKQQELVHCLETYLKEKKVDIKSSAS